jgi:hypothetical protein
MLTFSISFIDFGFVGAFFCRNNTSDDLNTDGKYEAAKTFQ